MDTLVVIAKLMTFLLLAGFMTFLGILVLSIRRRSFEEERETNELAVAWWVMAVLASGGMLTIPALGWALWAL